MIFNIINPTGNILSNLIYLIITLTIFISFTYLCLNLFEKGEDIINLYKGKYKLEDVLDISKSHGGAMKHFIMDCYKNGLINLYHTFDGTDRWHKTTLDALDNVLEYPEIYTIRIELN